jgi:large repetitive protein
MKMGIVSRSGSRRFLKGSLAVALLAGVSITPAALALVASPAGAAATSGYSPATPQLATITSPAGCTGSACAPWNLSQGDSAFPSYPEADLVPSYVPGGPTTSTGGTTEPNLAVYPSAGSGTAGISPYPSGTVGTPGPLDDYCGTGDQTATGESSPTSTPSRQPAGTTLPLAPAYFPHVVQNADGSLTGYFDYRPKDADEALVIAKSTDGGHNWVYEGESLEQNPGYCPSADINDDGEGHANVISVGGVSRLYTLERAAGDATGVGMLVHTLSPDLGSAAAPFGLPSTEQSGIDPNSFVPSGTATVAVTQGAASTITLTSTGSANSPEQLVAGGFVDLTQTPVPTASSVITCTGVSATTLTNCTTPAGSTVNVAAGDLIEQVIGYVNGATTIPAGPNNSIGSGGIGTISVITTATGSTKGFTNALTGTTYNVNAPDRAYIDGVAVYCDQANANPTTKMEDCTTGPAGSALNAVTGDPITSDPIIPATATMTSGLVAPDGIVGTLPSYPGAPSGSTIVMYTEKELAYYVAGTTTNSKSTTFGSAAFTLTFVPSPYESEDMPATISAASPVTVQMGDDTTGTSFVPVTCTGLTTGATDVLTGCTVPGAFTGDKYDSTSLIGAPGAATVSPSTLALTGEGSGSAAKLYKNNEDLTVLRVAYTNDGVTFDTAGLANGGIISGQNNCATTDPGICTSTSSYDDINNPAEAVSPSNLNTYADNDSANGSAGSSGGTDLGGTADLDEMRWVGSAGSIIVNPDGSYGLFLSGAWAADGDSDAFNQIFYSQSSDGENWSVPTPVVSTDYSFAASSFQDANPTTALGISAYYEGRAYGPSVVQHPDGTLTMLFAGYRLPKPIENAGTAVGTGSSQWTVGTTDPALYRNILVTTLTSATTPAVETATTITSGPTSPVVVGQTETVTASVSPVAPGTGTPTGTVTFSGTNGTLCTATLDESPADTASCSYTYTAPLASPDNVTANYGGDSNFAPSESPGTPVTVNPDATTTSTPSPTNGGGPANPGVVGEPITLSSTVTVNAPGAGTPTGSVSFSDGGATPLCSGTVTVASSTASCTYTPTITTTGAGEAIVATYSGDANDVGSTSAALDEVVDAASTTTTVTSNPPSPVAGQNITLTATVDAVAPSTGTPTGTVTFTLSDPVPTKGPGHLPALSCGNGGTSADTVHLSGGSATCTVPGLVVEQSPLVVTASYSGSPGFKGSTSPSLTDHIAKSPSMVTIAAKANPTVTSGPASFSAVVAAAAPGAGTPTGTVTWTIRSAGGPVVPCTTSDTTVDKGTGRTTCSVGPGKLFAANGPYTVSVTYSGDVNFASSTGTFTQNVSKAGSKVTLTTSGPAASGRPARITAIVGGVPASAGTPTGTVTFVLTSAKGAVVNCDSSNTSVLSAGVATCTVSSALVLAGSPYSVVATYNGDANFTTSVSSAKSIRVPK